MKRRHKNFKFIFSLIEIINLLFAKPYIGAPSQRSLKSVKCYLPNYCRNNLKFFIFKNCFNPIFQSDNSRNLYKKINLDLKNKPYILTVARFEDFKGHIRLIKFIEKNNFLKEKYNFIMIGDGKNLENCRSYVSNNLKNVFLIGSIAREDLFEFYDNCVAVFMPNYEEAFGISIVEAQFFKKAIFVFEPSLKLNDSYTSLQHTLHLTWTIHNL